MSRARELAKAGGKNQQVIAGLSSHVGVSTFAADVFMYSDLQVTGTTTFNGGTLTLGDSASDVYKRQPILRVLQEYLLLK